MCSFWGPLAGPWLAPGWPLAWPWLALGLALTGPWLENHPQINANRRYHTLMDANKRS